MKEGIIVEFNVSVKGLSHVKPWFSNAKLGAYGSKQTVWDKWKGT